MKQYFRERDGMGYTPQMTYKSKEKYGTTIGGCCSCCVSVFVTTYVVLLISAFLIGGRDYNAQVSPNIIPLNEQETYTIKATDSIPYIQILSYEKNDTPGELPVLSINNNKENLWRFVFEIQKNIDGKLSIEQYDGITCDIYMDTYLSDLNAD